jgi:hypothetical protein
MPLNLVWIGGRLCMVVRPRGVGGGEGRVCLLSAGDPSVTLRLLLRVSPSETSCSFTPTGFIYSVYLYQGFTPLPVFLRPYGTRGGVLVLPA